MRRSNRMAGVSAVVGAALMLFAFGGAAVPTTQTAAPTSAPSTQPVATVKGTVTAEGDVPLAEMVVYLESPDPARKLAATQAVVKVSQKGAQFDPKLNV